MDASLKSDLQAAAFTSFVLFSIALAAGAVRLSSGGEISYGGNTYYPENTSYGRLDTIPAIADGADDQVPTCEVNIILPSAAAKALWTVAADQGVSAVVMMGTINRSTGVVIGVETLFTGEYNCPEFMVSGGEDRVVLLLTGQLGRLLEPNHERKLSPAFHKSIWPGELGLDNVTRLTRKIPWRASDPVATAMKAKGISRQGFSGLRDLVRK